MTSEVTYLAWQPPNDWMVFKTSDGILCITHSNPLVQKGNVTKNKMLAAGLTFQKAREVALKALEPKPKKGKVKKL